MSTISVITVVFNNAPFIEHCIESVRDQSYGDVEHIVVDGGSTDGTVEILERHSHSIARWVSESDRGIYDAMNKGIGLSSGRVVGFLNSDDFYADGGVLTDVMGTFGGGGVECVYGDLEYVRRLDTTRTVRRWRPGPYEPGSFEGGWHPPHPALFISRDVLRGMGGFSTEYSIAADYELMLRLFVARGCSWAYLPRVLVRMRTGGRSGASLAGILRSNIECYRAWGANGLSISPLFMLRKPLSKLGQLVWHPGDPR